MEINGSTSGTPIIEPNGPGYKGQSISHNDKLDGPSFGEWLNRSLENVNNIKIEADAAARKLVTGENKDIHGTMITMQKASIAMNLMTEVRNKIISAYDEIKRMQF